MNLYENHRIIIEFFGTRRNRGKSLNLMKNQVPGNMGTEAIFAKVFFNFNLAIFLHKMNINYELKIMISKFRFKKLKNI